MAGIVHGLLAGTLVASAVVYATTASIKQTSAKTCLELEKAADVWSRRNQQVVSQSNVNVFVKRDTVEGVKDIWNSEVVNAVNWVYNLQLGQRATGAIASLFK